MIPLPRYKDLQKFLFVKFSKKGYNISLQRNTSRIQKMRALFVISALTILTILPIVDIGYAYSPRENDCWSTDDPDGRPDHFEQGRTKVYVARKLIDEKEDVCDAEGFLLEYFCDEKFRTISERRLTCRQGCSEGACITQVLEEPFHEVAVEPVKPTVNTVVTNQADEKLGQRGEGSTFRFLDRTRKRVSSTFWRVFKWVSSLFN